MPLVELLCVPSVQVLNAQGQLRARRLEHEVVVVAHEAEGVDAPGMPRDGRGKDVEKRSPVVAVTVDRTPSDTARGDVEETVRKQRAQGTRHAPDGTPRGAAR